MMKLTFLRPIIYTDKLQETIAFYRDVLHFTLVEYNESWNWASLNKDEVWIMLAAPNEHEPFEGPKFTGSFYFTTDSVDELWEELQHTTTLCYGIENFDWKMREFAIYDNNGYVLQFGQPIE